MNYNSHNWICILALVLFIKKQREFVANLSIAVQVTIAGGSYMFQT